MDAKAREIEDEEPRGGKEEVNNAVPVQQRGVLQVDELPEIERGEAREKTSDCNPPN